MSLGSNIKKFRLMKKISLQKMADDLNAKHNLSLNKSTISRWENGADPSAVYVFYVAEYLGVTPADLLDLPVNEAEEVGETKLIPVYSSISCGPGSRVEESPVSYEPTPKDWLNGGDYFYAHAKGDSMINARIYDNDLLLIRKQKTVENGEIAAVRLENGEGVLKRVYIYDDQVVLQSENNKYPPIVLNSQDEVNIVGKLIRVVIKF